MTDKEREVKLYNILYKLVYQNFMTYSREDLERGLLFLSFYYSKIEITIEKNFLIKKYNTKHKNLKEFECIDCEYTTIEYKDLLSHIEEKHDDDIFLEFGNHPKSEIRKNPYIYNKYLQLIGGECPYCLKMSKSLLSTIKHISIKHQDKWNVYIKNKQVMKEISSRGLERCCDCGDFLPTIKSLKKHIRNHHFLTCKYCKLSFAKKSLEKHLSNECLKYYGSLKAEEEVIKLKNINWSNSIIKLTLVDFQYQYNIFCKKLNHSKKVNKKLKTKKNNLIICEYCGLFVKNMNEHLQKCPKRKNLIPKKEIEEGQTTLIKKEEKVQEEDNFTLKEQILKHKSEIEQYEEDINDELLMNEEQYYEDIRKKLEYNIQNYSEADKQKILKQYVYITKKSAIDITLRNEIRSYLYKIYRGYCQICGFTFRKPRDGENSFEMHNWDNKLVVKTKSYLVSSADSLCLCRNCSANIKFGAFNPLFMDKIYSLDNFNDKSLEEVKEFICTKIDRQVVIERFKELYEWDDIYALEITVNDEPKNIYMTNGHLIQFIAYLQLEEKYIQITLK